MNNMKKDNSFIKISLIALILFALMIFLPVGLAAPQALPIVMAVFIPIIGIAAFFLLFIGKKIIEGQESDFKHINQQVQQAEIENENQNNHFEMKQKGKIKNFQKFCPYCGEQVKHESKFCSVCGSTL